MSSVDLTRDNFLARLRDRAGGVAPTRRKKVERSRQQVITTRFDEKRWSRERKDSDHLQRDITDLFVGEGSRQRDETGQIPDLEEDHDDETGREPFENAPELVRDLWQTMYKPSPRFRRPGETYKDTRLNRKILKEVIEHPDYEKLHDLTMSDASMATMATHAFMDTLKTIVAKRQAEVRQSNRDRMDADGEGGGLPIPGGYPGPSADGEFDPNADSSDPSEGGGSPGQGGDNSAGSDSADDIDLDDLMNDEFDEELDGEGEEGIGEDHDGGGGPDVDQQDLERAINDAMKDALDEADEIDSIRRGIGLGRGEWAQMDPSTRLAILQKFRSPQMKALADIVGRMKRFAMSMQAQKIIDAPDEAFDVETGDDLRLLLRSEYVYLGDESTKPYFYLKYAEKDLLQYKRRGKEDAGKGPIFVCIDKSGSMSGQPFNWAMAVAESLRRICQDQDRDYFVTFFGNNSDRHRFDFPKGSDDFDKILEFLSAVANGGTQFDGVLTEAVDRCVEYGKRGAEKADIVFITDGQAHLSEDWIEEYNKKRAEHGIRQFSVFIGGARDYHQSPPVEFLDKFSDHVIAANELTEAAAEKIFRKV